MIESVLIGNTAKITMSFKTFAGSFSDTDELPVLNIYNDKILIETIKLSEDNHTSVGHYEYLYVIPNCYNSPLVFEVFGNIDGMPEVNRVSVKRLWVR